MDLEQKIKKNRTTVRHSMYLGDILNKWLEIEL